MVVRLEEDISTMDFASASMSASYSVGNRSVSSPSKDTVSSAAELTKCAVESSKVTPVTCGSSAISSATAFARS